MCARDAIPGPWQGPPRPCTLGLGVPPQDPWPTVRRLYPASALPRWTVPQGALLPRTQRWRLLSPTPSPSEMPHRTKAKICRPSFRNSAVRKSEDCTHPFPNGAPHQSPELHAPIPECSRAQTQKLHTPTSESCRALMSKMANPDSKYCASPKAKTARAQSGIRPCANPKIATARPP